MSVALKRRNEALKQENEKLRATNQRLHRRVQKMEGPVQAEIAALQWRADLYQEYSRQEFRRMINAHQQLRKCYMAAAPVLGISTGPLHSVVDYRFGQKLSDGVYANIFTKAGIESHDVAEVVVAAVGRVTARPTSSE